MENADKVLVTGGAGFIGSHLVDYLMDRGFSVTVLDNLSSGRTENIARWIGNPRFKFIRGDLLNYADLEKSLEGCGTVFHLAADPEVKRGSEKPELHYRQNVEATFRLLETIRKNGSVEKLVFASSSTVYGEASQIPTPETYSPLEPISVYGASKLACEALITAYAHTYGFKAVILRLANIIGPRSRHGVIYDFINKLLRNPRVLEILGDGTQTKSYLHVDDCVEAMVLASERSEPRVEVFNIGSEDWINVKRIAEIVVEELGLEGVEFKFTGGVDGGRGWPGDVKEMLLDISKIKRLGWKPRYNSEEAVRLTARALI
ncbi:MAG: GDP-mannose 4,6-dehydratase, partial [Thaumarchaeota archaeon]|nr:GDP-mannose 4,6-dehydratase [Nitrososphaerota archaeon]